MKGSRVFVSFFFLWPFVLFAQEEEDPNLTVGGYIKDMVSFNFADKDSVLIDNLIHNRINLAWYPGDHLTGKLELRSRIFFGDLVKAIPQYGKFIDVNNDYFDLSWMPVNENGLIVHTMVDRAYLRWNKNDWEITAGRQRINWGVNLAWNPNDLFNTYSFFDFDYEERPGSDALRVRKYTGYASELEIAIKVADSFEEQTAAIKYQVNKWNYDMQLIGGVMENNLALGAGWAGSIKNAGFKGEVTYLNHFDSKEDGVVGSISIDYSFPNSLYLNGSVLYNSYGSSDPNFFLASTGANLDIRSLSPYVWSTFVQTSYPVHPLVNTGLSTIAFPSDGSLFVNPFVTYSIHQNLDLDLIGQFFFSEGLDERYNAEAKYLFLRVKFSY